jgi:hypothetical protein
MAPYVDIRPCISAFHGLGPWTAPKEAEHHAQPCSSSFCGLRLRTAPDWGGCQQVKVLGTARQLFGGKKPQTRPNVDNSASFRVVSWPMTMSRRVEVPGTACGLFRGETAPIVTQLLQFWRLKVPNEAEYRRFSLVWDFLVAYSFQ